MEASSVLAKRDLNCLFQVILEYTSTFYHSGLAQNTCLCQNQDRYDPIQKAESCLVSSRHHFLVGTSAFGFPARPPFRLLISKMTLVDPVRYLPGVGPVAAKKLEKLSIFTVNDLLYHLPFRYDDFSRIVKINEIKPDQVLTAVGEVVEVKNQFTKNGKRLQRGTVTDGTGTLELIWFNQLYLPKSHPPGTKIAISGRVSWFGKNLAMISPQYETATDKGFIHTGRLVPIYPETSGLSSKWLRAKISSILSNYPLFADPLPEPLIRKYGLVNLNTALRQIHFPDTLKDSHQARNRLAFDELLVIHLSVLNKKALWQSRSSAVKISPAKQKIEKFIAGLPFCLTDSQIRSLQEILADLQESIPMNRLLEGDVGSGKTVVAAIAAYAVYLSGFRSVLMAPTEILTLQHYQTLKSLYSKSGLKISYVSGSHVNKENDWDILVGTHAVLYQNLPPKVGLVIVDEQHRFGVAQRDKLTSVANTPHFLTMTATPIPRTVALTLYGDLDLSLIDQLPQGRKPITTYVVPPNKRFDALTWAKKQLLENRTQAFVIYPLIDESETESMKTVRAATTEYTRLKNEFFSNLNVGLLHGRLKPKDKEEIINDFHLGKIQVLVSTPVVEVGLDIPKATLMIIEGADRFGLSQLHQLRGRIGRGSSESTCLLLTETDSHESISRLKYLTTTSSGSAIADLDLKLRGPGQIYGLAQHGFPNLKAASLTDGELLSITKQAARELQTELANLPELRKAVESYTISQASPN